MMTAVPKLPATYCLSLLRDLDIGLDGSELVVINRGDALWRIAYRSYGEGSAMWILCGAMPG